LTIEFCRKWTEIWPQAMVENASSLGGFFVCTKNFDMKSSDDEVELYIFILFRNYNINLNKIFI